jgi:RNA polymerase sigma-70 factor (ECF subfamily)
VAAFEAFYLRYVRRVTAFAAQRCSHAEDVADVVAQTFFRLIEAAERYEPERADPASFVLGIAANVVRELDRGRSRHQALVLKLIGHDLLGGDEIEQVESAIDAARRNHALKEALEAIPPIEAEMVRLVAGGRTPGQAAEELGITPTAARSRLARARRRVRDRATGALDGTATSTNPITNEE